jgi:hypothetical protein
VRSVSGLPGRKVIIGDNLSSHFSEKVLSLAKDNDISFTCLPPNSTHLAQPLDVAFYGPLKRSWRVVLDEWKTSQKKRSALVTKDAFPGLLKRLYSTIYPAGQEKSSNLVAGFKKSGINPFKPDEVIERIPGCSKNIPVQDSSSLPGSSTSGAVSEAVLDLLKTMRGVNETNNEQEPRKKKKRLTALPGCSISLEDVVASETSSTDKARTKKGKSTNLNKQRQSKKKRQREEDEDEGEESGHESLTAGKNIDTCWYRIIILQL